MTTITEKAGEVLIRIGEQNNVASRNGQQNTAIQNGNYRQHTVTQDSNNVEDSDSKSSQHAKNEAYRQSSTNTYLLNDVAQQTRNSFNNNNSSKQNEASHVIYTKHSSAVLQPQTTGSSSQSFTTRQVTRAKVSSNNNHSNGHGDNKEYKIITGVMDSANSNDKTLNNSFSSAETQRKTKNANHFVHTGPLAKDACYLCFKTVYQKEKVGPVRDVVYHKQCFRCVVCNSVLTLSSFCHNHKDMADKRLYCKSHQPNAESSRGDIEDMNIKAGINKPKYDQVNTNVRGAPGADKIGPIGADTLVIKGQINAPKLSTYNTNVRIAEKDNNKSESFDHRAMNIQSAMHVPKLDIYNSNVRVNAEAQKGEMINHNSMGVQTAMHVPKLQTYNQNVRPVAALALVPPTTVDIDPTAYMARQLNSPEYTTPPTPPVHQHVQWEPTSSLYYYAKTE